MDQKRRLIAQKRKNKSQHAFPNQTEQQINKRICPETGTGSAFKEVNEKKKRTRQRTREG